MIALLFTLLSSTAMAQPTAIVSATALTGEGRIENATIVIRDDRIVSVEPGGSVPEGATRIDGAGMIVTPGFVGLGTPIGLVEILLETSTRDEAPENDDADPVRADFRASDGLNPRSTLLPIARSGGVTSVLATPMGGLVSGTSAWLDLGPPSPIPMLSKPIAAMHANLIGGGLDRVGGTQSSALTRLRGVLEDARLYGRQRAAFDRRALREMTASRADLERLEDVLSRRIPLVVQVSRAADILRVLELGREYGVTLVLSAVEEGWLVAREIAAANVPVIVQPLTDLPGTFASLASRYDNAALLAAAGVRVMIRAEGAHEMRTLRQEAGNAVANGLDPQLALQAITALPAQVFGMRDYGTIAAGRIANLVLWSGDPFETTTVARRVFVRGREVPMRTRQTALFERYRTP